MMNTLLRGIFVAVVIFQLSTSVECAANSKAFSPVNNLLKLLKDNTGWKFLSGAFGGYSNVGNEDGFSLGQADGIRKLTGKSPAIYGIDCAQGWGKTAPGREADLIECFNPQAAEYAKRGGILAVSHHLPNPVFAGNNYGGPEGGLKKQISNDQYREILKDGTQARQRWFRILDKIAAGLAAYQARGIAVMYRPLHEMNGEWFWWGATGYNTNDVQRMDLYKKLWRDMFNFFTYHKGLNNLLWVYAPDAKREFKSGFYPGGDVVDVVGLDAYLDDFNNLAGYDEMLRLGKPFGLAEVGPDQKSGSFEYGWMVETIAKRFPKTTFFIPWNNKWSPLKNKNAWGAYNNGKVMNVGNFKY